MTGVPNTITDARWADMCRRAEKVRESLLSAEVTRRRKAAAAQKGKAEQS